MSERLQRYSGPRSAIDAVDELFAGTLEYLERSFEHGFYDKALLGQPRPEVEAAIFTSHRFNPVKTSTGRLSASYGEASFTEEEIRLLGGGLSIAIPRPGMRQVVNWSFPIAGNLSLARSAIEEYAGPPSPNKLDLEPTGNDSGTIRFAAILNPRMLDSGSAEHMRKDAEENAAQLAGLIGAASEAAEAFNKTLIGFIASACHRRFDQLKRRDWFLQQLNKVNVP